MNTTSTIGPVKFDCYDMTTTPNNGSFSNNLTFAQNQSNSLPSWLSFDSSTSTITSTNPDTASSDTYTITNTYTGVFGTSIALTTNLKITVAGLTSTNNTNSTNTNSTNTNSTNTSSDSKNDDNYCLDTSSEAVCGIVVTVIIVAGLALIIFIAVCCFYILKKVRKRANRVQVERDPQSIQQNDGLPMALPDIHQTNRQTMEIQDIPSETIERCVDGTLQASDNQL